MTVETVDSRVGRMRWRELLDRAAAGDDTVIARNRQPTAVLIPYRDYTEMQHELAELRAERRAVAAYEEWERDPSTGRDWEEFKAELNKGVPADG